MILKALHGKPLPVYGKGDNVRDWLYVEDHARALHADPDAGQAGRELQYRRRRRAHQPRRGDARSARCSTRCGRASPHRPHAGLITFVADRPGPRPALRDRRGKIAAASSAGAARDASRRAAQDRRLVSRQPLVVGADLVASAIAASGSGYGRAPDRGRP